MEFAPKGLKVGDVFEDCYGNKLRVTQVFDFGYNAQPIENEPKQVELSDLPFAPEEEEEKQEAPKKRGGRRKATN